VGRNESGRARRPEVLVNDRLEILEELVLLAIPRVAEEIRLTFTRARASGKDVSWHGLRVFWKSDSGEWRPGKAGITIRSKELKPITEALIKAAAGPAMRPTPAPQRPPGARPPDHRRTVAHQPSLPSEPPPGRFDDDAPDPEGLF
jgi:Transcriptional Coactivator p15 (PC4)